jgi:hypothetical protein
LKRKRVRLRGTTGEAIQSGGESFSVSNSHADHQSSFVVVDRLFQCRQCQDLLENNLAHKRPIEGTFPCRFCDFFIDMALITSTRREEESGSPPARYQQGVFLLSTTGFFLEVDAW